MDYHSLAAAQLANRPSPPRKDRGAEERYWRGQVELPRPRLGLLVPVAAAAGVVVMLIGIAQA